VKTTRRLPATQFHQIRFGLINNPLRDRIESSY
jgi:hypothetical protein